MKLSTHFSIIGKDFVERELDVAQA